MRELFGIAGLVVVTAALHMVITDAIAMWQENEDDDEEINDSTDIDDISLFLGRIIKHYQGR